jgi:hypothetical protein
MQIARQLVGKSKFQALVSQVDAEEKEDNELQQDYLTKQLLNKN